MNSPPDTTIATETRYMAKVLVIDDSRIDAAFLSEMLQSFGCRVDASANGYDAVNKLDKRYDLVVLDINMPEISGLEIANGLRSFNKSGHHTPIILVSGEEYSPAMEDKCMQLGVEGYIQKPARREEIALALKAYLSTNEIKLFRHNSGTSHSRGFIKLHKRQA